MKITKKNAATIKRAAKILGSRANAAKHFDVTAATIGNYINLKTAVPIGTVLMAETVIREESK